MSSFIVEGGHKLEGSIEPQGAKNEALQVICATLLTSEKVTISNIPNIADIRNLIALLEEMGVKTEHINGHTISFEASDINLPYLKSEAFREKAQSLRGSVMIVGPLLARFGTAMLPKPGGDKIGRRRLDTHFLGWQKLGAKFEYISENRSYHISAPDGLKGCYLLLDEASVTGTANIIMAAALAEGETIIYNAACEPYIQQLCRMLVKMGANIKGIGSNLLTITGVEKLKGAEHKMLPDMIEVGSFIGAAAMTGSNIILENVGIKDLGIMPACFSRLGINMTLEGDNIH
ncbi:MAG: UDP-N-acetylglucosamine 1-carboxyvinyltransferase, partial [Muribaculaceae bacterium]|nr:UDP-N-acetylglucosamine 1-carboxyvinyltransferase [Muribaculaceae bacterium]